jgi:holo-[acyl-carrier protein] synthase
MIKGIGTDIIEVSRIKSNIEKHGQMFLDKVFTKEEQSYCSSFKESARNYAGRFAAKESVVKALGTGLIGHITWVDIEILNDAQGKPYLRFSEKFAKAFSNPNIHISISHCHEYATGLAIWEE